jgi:phosphoribosylformimino-5-aminoimidazole carboxamide ribonucleotide (ProFAR) isomerase
MLPGPRGPEPARDVSGEPVDLFEVVERLAGVYPRLYLVDLDGIERNRPQLDYLSELSRSMELWVDAGIRTGDQVIDVLVAGARRAVLGSSHLLEARQVKRAWRLSPELVFEIELRGGRLEAADPAWAGQPLVTVAAQVRNVGVTEFVVSFRDEEVRWDVVRDLRGSLDGASLWVNGTFARSEAPLLAGAGATGGIFHIDSEVAANPTRAAP